MTDEIKNDKSDQTTGQPASSSPVQDNQAIDAAKDAAAKAQEIAREGFNTVKKKFDEAGGVEGLKSKGKGFLAEVNAGFIPDEQATGFNGFKSRVKNLWKSGKSGKISIVAVSLVLLMIIGNCGGDGDVGETGSGISGDHGITIKGLYIGMSLEDAESTLTKLFQGTSWTVRPPEELNNGNTKLAAVADEEFDLWNRVVIFVDSQKGVVKELYMDEGAINFLFNVSDMDGAEFAAAIVENYDVPLMQPEFSDDGNLYWEYKDPRGVLLKIKDNKTLTMEKIASAAERKFD